MRPFLKILYENRGEKTKEHDGETLKTSNVSNKIICRPPQYREIIPLMYYTYEGGLSWEDHAVPGQGGQVHGTCTKQNSFTVREKNEPKFKCHRMLVNWVE